MDHVVPPFVTPAWLIVTIVKIVQQSACFVTHERPSNPAAVVPFFYGCTYVMLCVLVL